MANDALSTVKMPAFVPASTAAAARESAPVQPSQVERATQDAKATVTDAAAVKAAAAQIDSYLKSTNHELDFRLDSETGQMIVSVRDKATGDLIRQIPGEEVLRMARALKAGAAALVSLKV